MNERAHWIIVRMMRYPRHTLPWHRRLVLEVRDAVLRPCVRCRRYAVIKSIGGFLVFDSIERRPVAGVFKERHQPGQIALALNAAAQEDEAPCGPARW